MVILSWVQITFYMLVMICIVILLCDSLQWLYMVIVLNSWLLWFPFQRAAMYHSKLITSDLQFGFKAKWSTNLCSLILKETISYYDYYLTNNSTVFCTFLDATRAFDRIRYFKLFCLLWIVVSRLICLGCYCVFIPVILYVLPGMVSYLNIFSY